MSQIRYLSPDEVQFRRREGSATIDAYVDGEWHLDMHVHRTLPLSNPNELLSIRKDKHQELGILETVEGLDPSSRAALDWELDRRYFTPAITSVLELENEASMWRFKVETTRGTTEFFVRNWRDSAHELTPGRWQIMSVDGGRYEIIDLNQLDDRSQLLIEQLL